MDYFTILIWRVIFPHEGAECSYLLAVWCQLFVPQLHRILEYNTKVRLLVVFENVL